MKQLLFFILFPCLAMAQYQGNGNQKITLGEQTTADGLVYRGVENDTALITPSSDTSAYIILDTVNNRFYNYNRATNVWSLAGGGVSVSSFSTGTTGLTPSTATTGAVTLGGTLAVANGGTGSTTKNFVDLTTTQSIGGAKTFSLLLTAVGGTTSYNASALPTATISTTTTGAISGVYTSIKIGARGQAGQDQSVAITNVPTADGSSAIAFTTYNNYSYAERMRIASTGNVGIGQTTPTAVLHLKAGTATAGTAPLKFTSGVNLTSPLGGEMEFNGTNLFFSPSTTRHTVNHGLTGSATLNFPSTTTLLSADLTITVTGAADGDVVSLGVPNAAVNANTSYSAWVSAANTVTVRFNNYSSGTVDPASGLFKVFVTK